MTDLKYFLICTFGFVLLVTGVCVYFLSVDEQYVAAYSNCVHSYDSCAFTYDKFYHDYKQNCNNGCLRNNYPNPNTYPSYDPYVYIGDVNVGITLFSIGSAFVFVTFPTMTYRLVGRSQSQANFTETVAQTEQHQERRGTFYTFGRRFINIFRSSRTTNNQENVDAESTDVVGEEQPNANTGESQVIEIIESNPLEQEVEVIYTEKEESLVRKREDFTQLINDTKEKLDSVLQVHLDILLEAHEELCKNDNPFANKQLEKAKGELSSKLSHQEITTLLDKQRTLMELDSLAEHD